MYHYLILISSTAIVFGFIFDSFITIVPPAMSHLSHGHTADDYSALFLTVVFLLILINSYAYKLKGERLKLSGSQDDFDESKDRLSIMVNGMTCSHCKESVETAVYSCSGVESTSVDLSTGQVIVIGTRFDEGIIKDKIKRKGFSLS